MKRISLILVCLALSLSAFAQKVDDTKLASVHFQVIKAFNDKPVRNAAIILHPLKKDGKQAKGGLELKTDPDGKASFDGLPFGKIRIQVIAEGYSTYGDDFEITQADHSFTIKMERPKPQVTIYKDEKKDDKKDEKKPDEKKPETKPPDPVKN